MRAKPGVVLCFQAKKTISFYHWPKPFFTADPSMVLLAVKSA